MLQSWHYDRTGKWMFWVTQFIDKTTSKYSDYPKENELNRVTVQIRRVVGLVHTFEIIELYWGLETSGK